MKKAIKFIGWLVAALFAVSIYLGASELTRLGLGLLAVLLYGFYTLANMIEAGQKRADAALERLEESVHRLAGTQLSPYEQDGLVDLINAHRAAKRPIDDA